MAGSRPGYPGWIFYPSAGCLCGARDLQQYKELLRISVLRFIEDDAVIIFANAAHYIRKPHEFSSERHLVRILDEAALESEFAVIALHFSSNTKSARINPITQRSKSFAPERHKMLRRRGAWRPRGKLIGVAPPFFPVLQLGFRFGNVRRWLFVSGIYFGEVRVRVRHLQFNRGQIDLGIVSEFHQLPRLHVTQKQKACFFS